MLDRKERCSRRNFLASAASLTLAGGLGQGTDATAATGPYAFLSRPKLPSRDGRKPLALLASVYRPMAHAYHLGARFLYGYGRDGVQHVPRHYLASLMVDQAPDNDLSRDLARRADVFVTRSVAEALTLGGSDLAVDGVLLVAEHGNYPRNDKEQILYPRFEMLEQVVAVFRRAGRSVPVFCDKHLSYSRDKARQMYAWSQELRFPLLAGSSLPLTWRRPELELSLGTPIEDALVAAHGPLEVYGFHALEALQCMLERRKGGETGVRAVTCLRDKAVWRAADEGRWSWDLLDAALARSETVNPGDVRDNVGWPVLAMPAVPAVAFLIDYLDGTRGTVLLLNGHVRDFTFAARTKGESRLASCLFDLPEAPGAKFFDPLVASIEKLLETRRAPVPLERTVLTGGVLDALLDSHQRRGQRVETPDLRLGYPVSPDSGFFRGSIALHG